MVILGGWVFLMSEVPLYLECEAEHLGVHVAFFFFFSTLDTGPGRSLSLKLSDARVYEPQIRARLGTTAHLCEVVDLKSRAVPRERG